MSTATSGSMVRRSQAERSGSTRRRILDAAVDCLVELGYVGTSTTRIADRAGVSRGAQLHHFPTRGELLAAAVDHLAAERLAAFERQSKRLPDGTGRPAAVLDLLWSHFSGPLFQVALELWVAARTDEELRRALVPVERRIGRRIADVARRSFGDGIASHPDFDARLLLALNAMRGLAASQSYDKQPARLRRHWTLTRRALAAVFLQED